MKILIRYSLVLCLLLFPLRGVAQEIEGLRHGVLDNGLTYYVKHSDLQKGEVSFYLVQNVGAILEEDRENGLAHFLEHMAFNATRNFPEGVMSFLKSRGVSTFNASTGQNETMYNITDVPTADAGLLDSCLLVLRDWCDGISLTKRDIDKERGIIVEEWRTGEGVERRMQHRTAPHIFNGSKYADRDVIGDPELIKSFAPRTLRKFYQKWYRPDLQMVVVVGDVNEAEFEAKIERFFGSLKMPSKPLPRYETPIEDNAEPEYALLLDPQNRTKSTCIYKRVRKQDYNSDLERRRTVVSVDFFNSLISKRIARLQNDDAEEFISASVSFYPLVRGYNTCTFQIVPFENRDREALRQIWALWEDVRTNGFTDEEFEAEQQSKYRSLKMAEMSMDQAGNDYYLNEFMYGFLYGNIPMDIADRLQWNMEEVLELMPEDLNDWIASWADDANLLMIVEGNDPAYPYLTEADFKSVLAEKPVPDAPRRKKTDAPLMDFEPTPGKLVATERIARFDAEVWTLSNGAKVVYKNVPMGRGSFSFIANSNGGTSVVDASDLPSLSAMRALVLKSGLYHHSRNDLQDIVGGKNMKVNLIVNDMTEGIGGSSPTQFAEEFFRFFYLLVEKPVFGRSQFDKYIQKSKYTIDSTPDSPLQAVNDSISALTVRPNDRIRKFDAQYLSEMDFDRIELLFHERFGNAADFTYCILGDIPRNEALALACKYIGSLPSDPSKREDFVLHDFAVDDQLIRRTFTVEGDDTKGISMISFGNKLDLSRKDVLAFDILASVLQERYFRIIREEHGGAYGVSVDGTASSWPRNAQSLYVEFESAQDRVEELKGYVYAELEKIRREGITARELSDAAISMKRNRERGAEQQDMGYWLGVLNNYMERGVDITSPDYFENIIDTITVADIARVTDEFLATAKTRDFVIRYVQKPTAHY